jgi:hypothetical protein
MCDADAEALPATVRIVNGAFDEGLRFGGVAA